MTHLRYLSLIIMGGATLALAGCGSSSGSGSNSSSGSASGGGSVTHVDGTIAASANGDGFTLTPKHGAPAIDFKVGGSVEGVQLKALEASGAPARVSYRDTGDDPLTAVSVEAAPKIGEGLQSFVGTLTDVETGKLVLKGDDGSSRTFTISAEDAESFELPHLRDHMKQHSAIRVYFDPKQPDAALAYEDA
jgi:hypothetical protein